LVFKGREKEELEKFIKGYHVAFAQAVQSANEQQEDHR
jgi:hypothetical protein